MKYGLIFFRRVNQCLNWEQIKEGMQSIIKNART